MSGADIAARVAAGIAKAGQLAGPGTAYAATILRTTGADESVYPPTPGTTTEYACEIVMLQYTARDRDSTEITGRDVRVLVSPTAETDPRNGDKMRIDGEVHEVVNVMPVKPGGTVLMWDCQVRSADV